MYDLMLEPRRFETDRDKLRAVVHYICYRKRERPKQLSKTKLHKVLFYSDVKAYLALERPITGERYIKNQFGPYSTHLDEVIAALEASGDLVVSQEEFDVSGEVGTHYLFFSKSTPDLSTFTPDEISIIDEFIDKICPLPAAKVSELSHDVVWRSREMWEEIPYHSAFLYTLGDVRPQDMDWAREQLARRDQS